MGGATDFQGLYFQSNSGVKLNIGNSNVTIDYLFISEGITIQTSNGTTAGQINWSQVNNDGHFVIQNVIEGTQEWGDINENYASHIHLYQMHGGSVYLNDMGTLNSNLSSDNTIYATALFATIGNSLYTDNDDGSYTRTLLSGDYEGWNGNVVMDGAKVTTVNATSTGLSVTYTAAPSPEPATASLSL